jgi:hypothetical protein
MFIESCGGAEPVRISARKHALPNLNFMRGKIRELEELSLEYKNTGAECASSAHLFETWARPVSHDG